MSEHRAPDLSSGANFRVLKAGLAMKSLARSNVHIAALGLLAAFASGVALASPQVPGESTQTTTGLLSTAEDSATALMRFLEARVRQDPEDAGANARLAGVYLQRLRETGSIDYLDLALRATRTSLASVPPSRNVTGLAALARVELASHDFAAARDHALELTKLDPGKGRYYALLSDALLELGDYEASEAALQTMARLDGRLTIEGETRQARKAFLRGDILGSQRHLSSALTLAQNLSDPPRETIAWSQWQLGEYAFSSGDYEAATRLYGDSLSTFPDYFNALASMGRVRAAGGDLKSAIEFYEHAVRRLPDPTFVGALGDLYKLAGRDKDAAAQYKLVEQIGYLSVASGALYNRQLALFHADHDMQSNEAYPSAVKEYEIRHDIFGADTVAWTALKAKKIEEAQTAIKQALRLGTQDARLFYHAGMIARAAGNETAAREHFRRALDLNPQFDPLQATSLKAIFGE